MSLEKFIARILSGAEHTAPSGQVYRRGGLKGAKDVVEGLARKGARKAKGAASKGWDAALGAGLEDFAEGPMNRAVGYLKENPGKVAVGAGAIGAGGIGGYMAGKKKKKPEYLDGD